MTITDFRQRSTLDALLRTEFAAFTWKVFTTQNAGREEAFIRNWHIDALCHILEEARQGRHSNAVINMPPRHSKSTVAAVAFTAWLLGHDSTAKVLVACHTQRLARMHTETTRTIMETDWYRRIFPQTRIAAGSTGTELRTTAGGIRMAVTAGVATMGFDADAIVIDDLLDAMEARSETEREKVIDYTDSALLTRLTDPANGLVICIHQRLHENDPAGHLLNAGGYAHFNFPAIAEEDERIALGHGRTIARAKGTALFSQRFGLDFLAQKRLELGTAKFQMLYQQNPISAEGSVLRWEWFDTYEQVLPRHHYELIVQSWDTANSSTTGNAHSVCTIWGYRQRKLYLLDVFRDLLEYPELRRQVLSLADKWMPDKILIEKAASGIQLLQELKREHPSLYVPIKPLQDKQTRFEAACAPVEAGHVLLPRRASWLRGFKRELQGFPLATNRDQADSFSQFLNWSAGVGFNRALGRDHPVNVERRATIEARRRRR